MGKHHFKCEKAGRKWNTDKLTLCLALAAAFPAGAATDLTTVSLEQLLELKVVGASKYEQKQSEVAAAASVITRDEIRAFGWRTLSEALSSLPGIHSTYDHQYSLIGARGFGLPGDLNTRILLTINGNRVNDAVFDSGPTGRAFPLDLDLVERIEFIPGPGGAVYGQNAMLGVVNVITRTGADIKGTELSARLEHPGVQHEERATWGRKLDNGFDVVLSATTMSARGRDLFFDYGAAGVSGVARGQNGERLKQFFGSVSAGPWAFDFVDGKRRKDDPTGVYQSDPFVAGSYQSDRYTLAQAQYKTRFLDDMLEFHGRLFAGQEQYDSTLTFGTPISTPATSVWHGGEFRLLYQGISGHKMLLGVELQNNTRADQYVIDSANPANNLRFNSAGFRKGLYVQDEWRLANQWTATAGLRIDHNNSTGTQTSPRAALIWRASQATTLKALYGRAHRAPNGYERDYGDGQTQLSNLALKGESIDTLELVADQRFGNDMQLRASVYQWTIRDLISLGVDPVLNLPQYQSGADVKANGLEVSADKSWGWGARLRGSVALQHVRRSGAEALLNSPSLLGRINFSAPLPVAGLRLGYELLYDSARLTKDGSETGGYAVSNVHLRTSRLINGVELSFGVRNLFGKQYAYPGSNNNWQNALQQNGRTAYVGALFRF